MRKWIFALSAVVALVAADEGRASGWGCNSCGGGYATAPGQPHVGFLAAPWYLYWPYDAHFMTPAPVHGAYYAPPGYGYGAYPGYAQPYFPAHDVPLLNVHPAHPVDPAPLHGGVIPPG
jgi:hypothetical protein